MTMELPFTGATISAIAGASAPGDGEGAGTIVSDCCTTNGICGSINL